eukprot:Amastigsp_a340717_227.p2 type:complete len:139 gc:universal Amastigsp_a340717_227:344-760(+)
MAEESQGETVYGGGSPRLKTQNEKYNLPSRTPDNMSSGCDSAPTRQPLLACFKPSSTAAADSCTARCSSTATSAVASTPAAASCSAGTTNAFKSCACSRVAPIRASCRAAASRSSCRLEPDIVIRFSASLIRGITMIV